MVWEWLGLACTMSDGSECSGVEFARGGVMVRDADLWGWIEELVTFGVTETVARVPSAGQEPG